VASVLEERTGRHCLFVPWGRLALYLTLRTWLSPGDRILMSPGRRRHPVRRAGRRAPVMAPVSANAGERSNELAEAVRSSSRVGILSVLAVAPHAHATLGATALHSCPGLFPLGASSSRVS
jgi:hypothetical protein